MLKRELQSPAAADCPTPGAAVDAVASDDRAVRPVLHALADDDLAREWQGGMSVADLLAFYAEHTRDHVAQIETARGAIALPTS